MLSGTCDELPTGELAGGARIRAVFLDVFGRAMRDLRPLQELSDDEIRTAIANSGGVCGALLVRLVGLICAAPPSLPWRARSLARSDSSFRRLCRRLTATKP